MDWFTMFLVKLSQPLLLFIGCCFTLLVKMDRWWTKKNDTTKLNIRWILFTGLLMALGIAQQIQNTDANIVNHNRTVVNDRMYIDKIKELEEWKINRLENEISELKELRKNTLENEKEIQRLNSKK